MSAFLGILALAPTIALVVRERGSRRAVFVALALSALFYAASPMLDAISYSPARRADRIRLTKRLVVPKWILERFSLILALAAALLFLIDSANLLRRTDHKHSLGRHWTILKRTAIGLVGLAVAMVFAISVLHGVFDKYVLGQGQPYYRYMPVEYSHLLKCRLIYCPTRTVIEAELALNQLLGVTFIVALAVILALGVKLWRQFTEAGLHDVVSLRYPGQPLEILNPLHSPRSQ